MRVSQPVDPITFNVTLCATRRRFAGFCPVALLSVIHLQRLFSALSSAVAVLQAVKSLSYLHHLPNAVVVLARPYFKLRRPKKLEGLHLCYLSTLLLSVFVAVFGDFLPSLVQHHVYFCRPTHRANKKGVGTTRGWLPKDFCTLYPVFRSLAYWGFSSEIIAMQCKT